MDGGTISITNFGENLPIFVGFELVGFVTCVYKI